MVGKEDDPFLLGFGNFSGGQGLTVKLREGNKAIFPGGWHWGVPLDSHETRYPIPLHAADAQNI